MAEPGNARQGGGFGVDGSTGNDAIRFSMYFDLRNENMSLWIRDGVRKMGRRRIPEFLAQAVE